VQSGLFGITHSNRSVDDHWGKNSFNSSFPTAVACYMLSHDIPAIYNRLEFVNGKPKVISTEISLRDVFSSNARSLEEFYFDFEGRFEPYQQYAFDNIGNIDLVIKSHSEKSYLACLEIKLTVLPTSQTSHLPEDKWGCELVIRSATTSYCALGMYDSIKNLAPDVREIFETACLSVESWTNGFEMNQKTPILTDRINEFEKVYLDHQKPLLMQAIWKTQGQSPLLAHNAFDIIIWSDYAFSRLFLDNANKPNKDGMSRPMRATARLAQCLWELSKSGKTNLNSIYKQISFTRQNDKEFAIGGRKWSKYVTSSRLANPILESSIINEIIEPGYIEKLKPERRFDQTLYFTRIFQ